KDIAETDARARALCFASEVARHGAPASVIRLDDQPGPGPNGIAPGGFVGRDAEAHTPVVRGEFTENDRTVAELDGASRAGRTVVIHRHAAAIESVAVGKVEAHPGLLCRLHDPRDTASDPKTDRQDKTDRDREDDPDRGDVRAADHAKYR